MNGDAKVLDFSSHGILGGYCSQLKLPFNGLGILGFLSDLFSARKAHENTLRILTVQSSVPQPVLQVQLPSTFGRKLFWLALSFRIDSTLTITQSRTLEPRIRDRSSNKAPTAT